MGDSDDAKVALTVGEADTVALTVGDSVVMVGTAENAASINEGVIEGTILLAGGPMSMGGSILGVVMVTTKVDESLAGSTHESCVGGTFLLSLLSL